MRAVFKRVLFLRNIRYGFVIVEGNMIIGYVQIYFKIIGQKETYYASLEGDFEKPITRFRLRSAKRSIRKFFEEIDKIHSIEFCSKEEWKRHQCGNSIVVEFGE